MEQLAAILARLPERHRAALFWFSERAGTDQPWPKNLSSLEGDTLLATKAKGIYKPNWSHYALSIRQTMGGPYPDRPPVVRADGTWVYLYFQENADFTARDDEYTNRGLIECLRDRVPVGVMRQISDKPQSIYNILGVAMVAGWDGGYFFLEGFASDGHAMSPGPTAEMDFIATEQLQLNLNSGAFDPSSILDARERTVAQIVRRRGQPEFRKRLLHAYESRCAISSCDAQEVLEAAHILPYRGPETNRVENGLLLRSDLHTLFDLGLISINADAMHTVVAAGLMDTQYRALAGAQVRMPIDASARPNAEALRLHRQWSGL